MLRSLLLLAGLTLLLAGSCNSSKTATVPAAPTSTTATAPAPPANAQRPNRQGAAGQRLTEAITRLDLDEAQATKFQEITQRYAQQGRELREQASGDRQAMRTANQEMRAKMDAEVNAMLTKDQQAVYATIKAEQQEQMRSRRGGGGGRPGGGRPGGGE